MADNPPIPASTLATLQQTESEDNWTQILSTITALPPLLVCSKPTHAKLLNLRTYILSDRSKLARNAMLLLTRLPLSLVEPLLPPLLKNSAKANHLYVSTARDVLRHLIDLHGLATHTPLFTETAINSLNKHSRQISLEAVKKIILHYGDSDAVAAQSDAIQCMLKHAVTDRDSVVRATAREVFDLVKEFGWFDVVRFSNGLSETVKKFLQITKTSIAKRNTISPTKYTVPVNNNRITKRYESLKTPARSATLSRSPSSSRPTTSTTLPRTGPQRVSVKEDPKKPPPPNVPRALRIPKPSRTIPSSPEKKPDHLKSLPRKLEPSKDNSLLNVESPSRIPKFTKRRSSTPEMKSGGRLFSEDSVDTLIITREDGERDDDEVGTVVGDEEIIDEKSDASIKEIISNDVHQDTTTTDESIHDKANQEPEKPHIKQPESDIEQEEYIEQEKINHIEQPETDIEQEEYIEQESIDLSGTPTKTPLRNTPASIYSRRVSTVLAFTPKPKQTHEPKQLKSNLAQLFKRFDADDIKGVCDSFGVLKEYLSVVDQDIGEIKKILMILNTLLRYPNNDEGWWYSYMHCVLDTKLSCNFTEDESLEISFDLETLIELFPTHIPSQIIIQNLSKYLRTTTNGNTEASMKILLALLQNNDSAWVEHNKNLIVRLFVYGLTASASGARKVGYDCICFLINKGVDGVLNEVLGIVQMELGKSRMVLIRQMIERRMKL